MVALAAVLSLDVTAVRAVGEPVNGFPNWAERVIHEWMNRARVDPQLEMTACGANCTEGSCYGVMPPLSWNLALNRAARFHSAEMVKQGYFGHSSLCPVVTNINTLYPDSCDGSASCACQSGPCTMSNPCGFDTRVSRFGGSPYGEIIASPSDPNFAFYLWLQEPGDSPPQGCDFTPKNGHRWLILTAPSAVGVGVSGYSTGDFGSGSAPTKIPSGSHYPQQAASVQAWANWYDTAGPAAAAINVDGMCTPMTLQRGTQTNGAWSATLTGLGSGCHRYYFSFRDSGNNLVTYPTTGSLAIGSGAACPDWDAARPASCDPSAPTFTPSLTPIPTRTNSATASRTGTATSTATATRTNTVPTPTRTLSPSPTATPTATPVPRTPTATATVILSGENIAGALRYYSNDQPVPGITVSAAVTSATSNASGQYELVNVPAANVLVQPSGTGAAGTVVGPLDASWVLQAVAQMRTLSPEQILACDVTGNGGISTLDATMILQYAVGLIDRLPVAMTCGSDWAFVPVPAAAPTQTLIPPQPGVNACTPGAIAYGAITDSLQGQDFDAVLFGDCTGNWRPPAAGGALRAGAAVRLRAGELRTLRGGRVVLPVGIESAESVRALSVRVRFDASALRVVHASAIGAARDALVVANATRPGELRLAVASGEAFLADGKPILAIVFDVLRGDRFAVPSVAVRLDDE